MSSRLVLATIFVFVPNIWCQSSTTVDVGIIPPPPLLAPENSSHFGTSGIRCADDKCDPKLSLIVRTFKCQSLNNLFLLTRTDTWCTSGARLSNRGGDSVSETEREYFWDGRSGICARRKVQSRGKGNTVSIKPNQDTEQQIVKNELYITEFGSCFQISSYINNFYK